MARRHGASLSHTNTLLAQIEAFEGELAGAVVFGNEQVLWQGEARWKCPCRAGPR